MMPENGPTVRSGLRQAHPKDYLTFATSAMHDPGRQLAPGMKVELAQDPVDV
jgi:hypothetical protein